MGGSDPPTHGTRFPSPGVTASLMVPGSRAVTPRDACRELSIDGVTPGPWRPQLRAGGSDCTHVTCHTSELSTAFYILYIGYVKVTVKDDVHEGCTLSR